MSNGFRTQAIQDLLTFPFRGPDARNRLLIAAVMGFAGFIVPIIPTLFLLGYGGLIMHRIIVEKGEAFLPEWKDWNRMLVLGLKLGGTMLIYSLPLVILLFGSYFGMMVPMFMDIFSGSQSSAEIGRSVALQFGGIFIWMCGFGLTMLLGAALWVALPAVLGHVVATDSFAAAFHFGDWWKILRANLGGFVVTTILLAGVYTATLLVAQVLYMTVVLCILLPFVLGLIWGYVWLIASALFGHAYVEAQERVAQLVPPAGDAPAAA